MSEDLSPMQKAFWNFDLANPKFTSQDYQNYVQTQFAQTQQTLNALLKEEIEWRKAHGMNFVASGEGWQGSGKSRGFSYLGWLIGNIYGVPFTPNNIYWRNNELDEALNKAIYGATFMKDEHQFRNIGLNSGVVQKSLADYENQLRENMNNLLFASVKLQEHNHFFVFEFLYPLWTEKDGKPYPKGFVAVLKTPKYGNRFLFVWRGIVIFPMPSEEFDQEYSKRKKEHIKLLQEKYGNNLDFIGVDTKEMIENHEKDFIQILQTGIVKPKTNALIENSINELKGSESYTRDVMKIVIQKIRDIIENKYKEQNEKILKEIAEAKRAAQEKKEKENAEKMREQSEYRKEKEKRMITELELKRKALEIKQEAAKQLGAILEKKMEKKEEAKT